MKRLLALVLAVGASQLAAPASAQNPRIYFNSLRVEYGACGDVSTTQVTCTTGGNTLRIFGPMIEFEQQTSANCTACGGNYPFNFLTLCVEVRGTTDVASLDSLEFELFKFLPGTNPNDPGSAPPLRTFSFFALGMGTCGTENCLSKCTLWDGFYNIEGFFGKSNGQFGFRATAKASYNNAQTGRVDLSATASYPGAGSVFGTVQYPMNVDVVNIHAIRSSPTVVGSITPVAAAPYNLLYRLSKDALVTLDIYDPLVGFTAPIRRIVPSLPRLGEGQPTGALTNGDFWNGRDDNGNIVQKGVFIARWNAVTSDAWGTDTAYTVDRQIGIDPLQITDVTILPLLNSNTSLAVLNYTLTEPATVYVDIWSSDTVFANIDVPYNLDPTNPNANRAAGNNGRLLRRITEFKEARTRVITFWDGRDSNNVPLPDDDYVFSINAQLPSALGTAPFTPVLIQNAKPQVGFVPLARGLVGISQISPGTGLFSSSPPISGLNPFVFGYSLSRDAIVNMRVISSTGAVVKTLVRGETRAGGQLIVERWEDGIQDDGLFPSSGTYTVQLFAQDTHFSAKVTTTSAQFPLNMFRIANLVSSPLLSGATDVVRLSFQFSQPMLSTWNIYPPGTVVSSTGSWPPSASSVKTPAGAVATPIHVVSGMRPGRFVITEFWDGRNQNGLFVPDGHYIYTLVAVSSTTPQYVAADRVIGGITVARGQIVIPFFNVVPSFPQVVSSSQSLALPPFEFDYLLTRQSSVTIRILNTQIPPKTVRNLVSGDVRESGILNRDFWDGRDDSGNFVPSGFYNVQLVAGDIATSFTSETTSQQTISVDPLRIYDVAVSPLRLDQPEAQVVYQISEPMKMVLKIYKPGTNFDVNGNASPPETVSLVRRIIGIRPSRVPVTELWDGRDEQLTVVSDGNYTFKLVGTTVSAAVDSITGNIAAGTNIASDIIISEIPVTRSGSADPAGDFEANTIAYPNPSRAATVTFKVRMPIRAGITLKLYTLNGDLLREVGAAQFASVSGAPACGAGDSYCVYVWNRDNSSGKRVAPGVYFAVIREESTTGERQVLQTVKKVLLQ